MPHTYGLSLFWMLKYNASQSLYVNDGFCKTARTISGVNDKWVSVCVRLSPYVLDASVCDDTIFLNPIIHRQEYALPLSGTHTHTTPQLQQSAG